jgi:ParB-like chromosome segregation protein Spo0J
MNADPKKPTELILNGVVFTTPFADLFPPLSQDKERELRADIKARGIICPIIVSEHNEVIDGANRLRIAVELSLSSIRIEVVQGLTPDQMRALAEDLNIHRRHLSRAEIQKVIDRRLRANPDQSNKLIATDLDVDDKTVGSRRRVLESSSDIPKSDKRVGRDGRKRAAKPRRSIREQEKAVTQIVNDAPADEQPRLFEPDEKQMVERPKTEKKPHSWWPELKGYSHRLARCSAELERLRKLKVADRSPQPVLQLAGELRKIADEATILANDAAA